MQNLSETAAVLLQWYDRNARKMPWRGIRDPYRTWVSETMLQQTRVETVIPYYDRFLSRFPSLEALACAEEAEVLKLWEGLGYYSRARNLLKGAQQVSELYRGILPSDPALLRKISGIGPYTAGAIASIAFGVPVPAVDGNVLRVFSRLYGIRENIRLPEIRKHLESLAAATVPADRPGDYNQAVMDLGATVCVPGTPDCRRCPLSACCNAFSAGDAADLPRMPRSAPQKIIRWSVPVVYSGGRVLLRRRTESLLHGLWCFPLLDCSIPEVPAHLAENLCLPSAVPDGPVKKARHVFTHLIWEMEVLPMRASEGLPAPDGYCWVSAAGLDQLALPSAMDVPLALALEMLV